MSRAVVLRRRTRGKHQGLESSVGGQYTTPPLCRPRFLVVRGARERGRLRLGGSRCDRLAHAHAQEEVPLDANRKQAGIEFLKGATLIVISLAVFVSCEVVKKDQSLQPKPENTEERPVVDTIHGFKVETATGEERSLADYKGKALLIVNTASKCGLTPQYAALEMLREKYAERGFEVLAFPANDFLWQEPGTNEEIQKFCDVNYAVTFPVFAKLSVKGGDIAPLYSYLTKDSGFPGDIEWNFAKFLVAPDGKVVARFNAKVDPLAPEIVQQIEQTLPH